MKKNQDFSKTWISGATKTVQIEKISGPKNLSLWFAAVAVVVFGVVATVYLDISATDYSSYSTSLVVVFLLLALVLARFTNQGSRFWIFLNSSKLELSRVVWPTRKETMSITAVVIVMTVVFALVISLFGFLFEKFIKYFLG